MISYEAVASFRVGVFCLFPQKMYRVSYLIFPSYIYHLLILSLSCSSRVYTQLSRLLQSGIGGILPRATGTPLHFKCICHPLSLHLADRLHPKVLWTRGGMQRQYAPPLSHSIPFHQSALVTAQSASLITLYTSIDHTASDAPHSFRIDSTILHLHLHSHPTSISTTHILIPYYHTATCASHSTRRPSRPRHRPHSHFRGRLGRCTAMDSRYGTQAQYGDAKQVIPVGKNKLR
jgi:hypothetical protein